MTPSKPIVQTYRQGHLSRLIKLYNHTLADTPHFIRDEDFLKYFMQCLGVNKDSIFVASVDDQITGLVIISITTENSGLKQGNIIELQAKDLPSTQALIQVALNFCKDKDVDMIVVVPLPLPKINAVFKDWLKLETGAMMAKALSISSLIRASLSNQEIRDSYEGKKIVFHIGEEIEKFGDITSESEKTAILITMSQQTFLKIIFGQVNPYVAYLTRKVKIHPMQNIFPILKLLRRMKMPTSLYVSLIDRI